MIVQRFTRLRPSPAMTIALVALFVALGGTSFAAVRLSIPANSVGTPQLRTGAVTNQKLARNAVTSSKVANHSITAVDIAPGALPVGPTGPPGPTGPGARWVLVSKDGHVIAQSPGLQATVARPDNGHYYVNFGSPVTGHVLSGTSVRHDDDGDLRGSVVVSACGGGPEGSQCSTSDNPNTVWVLTYGPANKNTIDHSFYLGVF
jgi:hypothetical protein